MVLFDVPTGTIFPYKLAFIEFYIGWERQTPRWRAVLAVLFSS
jgi:hypothetical protein